MTQPAAKAPLIAMRRGTPADRASYDQSLLSAWQQCDIKHDYPLRRYDTTAISSVGITEEDASGRAVDAINSILQAQGREAMAYSKSSLFHDARSFVRSVLSNKGSFRFFDFATVGHEEAIVLKEKTGLDLEGYQHSIDDDAVRHIMFKHGNMNAEIRRGQVGINADDLAMIPDIVGNYDSVEQGDVQRDGAKRLSIVKPMETEKPSTLKRFALGETSW